jgi:TfoX/Sxy family transcriptional regulator of competence genes
MYDIKEASRDQIRLSLPILATRSRGSITMRMLMGANGIYADGKAQPMTANGIYFCFSSFQMTILI